MRAGKRRSAACTLLLAIVIISGQAVAAETPPAWVRKPSPSDLLGVWPTAALKRGKGGKAVISCVVTTQGALRDCRVASESPAGEGFGNAAIALAPQLLMKPATKDGVPVEGKVNIPINFEQPDAPTGSHLAGDSPLNNNLRTVRVLSGIQWSKAPSVADMRAAFPEKAKAQKSDGHAVLDCVITGKGLLNDCTVLREEPTGLGFGHAARSLSGRFEGPTADGAGKSTGGARTQVPFTFAAASLQTEAPIIGEPRWTGLPKSEDLAAAFPPAALKAGVGKARVVLGCSVAAGGAVTACAVESEDPKDLGFGAAALSLTPAFRLSVWTAEGLPTVGGRVRIPLRYDFAIKEPPPSKP